MCILILISAWVKMQQYVWDRNYYWMQEQDLKITTRSDLKIVTRRQPTEEELRAMSFGWRVVKHVKSNAIVYTGTDRTLGIGAGQMSRVDSVDIAIQKAGDRVQGAVLASDAFFPFPDSIEKTAQAGIVAIIQPGGSRRDEEVIAACDKHGLPMIFTARRHFRH